MRPIFRMQGDGVKRTVAAMAAGVAFTLAACGPGKPTLSERFCQEVEQGTASGVLMARIKSGYYDSPRDAVDRAHGMVLLSCPELLDTNAWLRDYLQGWGIEPDQR